MQSSPKNNPIKWISSPFMRGSEDPEERTCFLCRSPGCEFKCSWCTVGIYYCSKEHYVHHRVNSRCTPFVQAKDGLAIARGVNSGEHILSERPLVRAPGLHAPPTCPVCLKRLLGEKKSTVCPSGCPLRLCTGPCSTRTDSHGPECKVLRENKVKVSVGNYGSPMSINSVVTVLRMLESKKGDPSTWSHFFPSVPMEERRKAKGEWELFQRDVVGYIRGRLFMGSTLGDEEIQFMIGLFVSYSVPLGPLGGRGLFPTFSLLKYDCIGNCRFSVDPKSGSLSLFARVALAKGESLTVNFSPSVLGTLKRRKRLKSLYHLECACARCVDPTELGTFLSALACEACEAGIMLPNRPLEPLSEWSCGDCDFLLSSRQAEGIIDAAEEELSAVSVGRNPRKLEDFIAHYEGLILHRDHYLLLLAKRNYVLIARKDRINRLANSHGPLTGGGPSLRKEELYEDFWWIIQRLALEDVF